MLVLFEGMVSFFWHETLNFCICGSHSEDALLQAQGAGKQMTSFLYVALVLALRGVYLKNSPHKRQ